MELDLHDHASRPPDPDDLDYRLDDTPPGPFRRSWAPVDLAALLDGAYEPPQPSVGRRTDGVGLFYAGKAHVVVSESEGGKTWLALSAALDEMKGGHHVVYVDFEDDEATVVGRLLVMGADRVLIAGTFHYLRPVDPIGTGIHRDDLARLLAQYRPSLAVIDGITEAMALHGLDPNKNDDAARFGRMLPRLLTEAGAAVVSLDHVTKDREGRGRWAIGAQHKLSGLDGAQYVLENRTPFGVGLTGRSTIRIAKDRPGQLRHHALPGPAGLTWFGDLVVASQGGFAEVEIVPPVERAEDFRPTVLMQRVAAALTEHGPLARRRIELAVTGKAASIRQALDFLILDGYVTETTPHKVLKPYPDDREQS